MLFLDEHQIERLADAVDSRYRALVYLLAYAGLRWGEAAALRRSAVDVLRGRIDITESLAEVGGDLHFGPTKNHRNRTITVPRFLREVLNDHLTTNSEPGSDSLVFTTARRTYSGGCVVGRGSPLRNTNFSRNVWKAAVAAADLPSGLRIHDLRHTTVALMIAEGAHPEKVKRHLGHGSIAVTMDTYGHLFPAEDGAIADRLHERRLRALADNTRTKAR